MNREQFLSKYWNYYLMLENDFSKTIRSVELDKKNFSTYSFEYSKQYLSICSEIDGLCKTICMSIEGKKYCEVKDYDMKIYTKIILNEYTDIQDKIIIVNSSGKLKLNPFKLWESNPKYNSPTWWGDYNNVKHNRIANFREANLENVINSLAGLFLLEMYLIREIAKIEAGVPDIPDESSRLFSINPWETKYINLGNNMMGEIDKAK